jgi:hypothetical protein
MAKEGGRDPTVDVRGDQRLASMFRVSPSGKVTPPTCSASRRRSSSNRIAQAPGSSRRKDPDRAPLVETPDVATIVKASKRHGQGQGEAFVASLEDRARTARGTSRAASRPPFLRRRRAAAGALNLTFASATPGLQNKGVIGDLAAGDGARGTASYRTCATDRPAPRPHLDHQAGQVTSTSGAARRLRRRSTWSARC